MPEKVRPDPRGPRLGHSVPHRQGGPRRAAPRSPSRGRAGRPTGLADEARAGAAGVLWLETPAAQVRSLTTLRRRPEQAGAGRRADLPGRRGWARVHATEGEGCDGQAAGEVGKVAAFVVEPVPDLFGREAGEEQVGAQIGLGGFGLLE